MRAAFLLFLCPAYLLAQCPLVDPAIVLRPDETGKAVAILTFISKPSNLSIGEFQPALKNTGIVLNTVRKLDPPDSDNKVALTVTNLIQPGTFEAPLSGTGVVCKLTAIRTISTYNVRVDSSTGDVLYAPDAAPVVRVANADAASYVFRAALLVHGEEKPLNGVVLLPPKGTVDIHLSPVTPDSDHRTGLAEYPHIFPLGWLARFISTGTLKDDTSQGELALYPAWTDAATGPAPRLLLPVTLRQRFFSEGLQEAMNLFWIVFFLLLGGVASIWFNFGLPNSQGALTLRRRLRNLCAKVDGTGEDLNSQWRAIICSRLQGIEDDLQAAIWPFPSFTSQLKILRAAVDMFEAWVDIAYQVSIVRRETREQLSTGVPPTLLFWIEEHCDNALSPIKSGATNADEINAMRAELKTAAQFLAALTANVPISELEAEIHRRESRVTAPGPAADAFAAAFSNGEFEEIVRLTKAAPHDIDIEDYVARDTNSLKLDIAMEMALRRAALKPVAAAARAGADGVPVPATPTLRADFTRLSDHWNRALDYLRPDNPESLRMAHVMVLEMHQDIYPEALMIEFAKAADGKATGVEIRSNLPEPKVNQEVGFSLAFTREILNTAAACREMSCEWIFNDETRKEIGWQVSHAFAREPPAGQKFTVSACVFDIGGNAVPNMPLTVEVPVKARHNAARERFWRLSAEAKLELSRLMLVLIIAVAATLAVARNRVQNTSVMLAAGALIGIGFASDQIKKLLAASADDGAS